MFEKPPSLVPGFLLCCALALDLTLYTVKDNWMKILAFYFIPMLIFLLTFYSIAYFIRAISWAKSQIDISRPDVRIVQAHAEISREIVKMDAMQRSHHLSIVNALQLPFQLDPNGSITTLDGYEIKVSNLLKYIDGVRLENRGETEGGSVYRMKPEREADPEDRDAIRHIADEIGRTYAVSDHHGNKPVLVTRDGLLKYVDAVLVKNGLAGT